MTIRSPSVYRCDASECAVGSNDGSAIAALDTQLSGILIIPKTYSNLPVTSIGNAAFRFCRLITEVRIEARIRVIKTRAFSEMNGLEKINIPSSCTSIEDYGIQFYNEGQSAGTVTITFEESSRINSIGNEVFGFKKSVIIIYPDSKSPSCHSNWKASVDSVVVLSHYEFKFCGVQAIKALSFCKTRNIQRRINSKIAFIILAFSY